MRTGPTVNARRSPATTSLSSATTFVLPDAEPRSLGTVELDVRSAENDARIEGEVLLAAEASRETRENARGFEDGALRRCSCEKICDE